MNHDILSELVPSGTLRAGINLSNFLLVTGRAASGDPIGVALAGLRPGLIADADKLRGARILDGRFTAVQQAVGTATTNRAGAAFLADFVEEAKASGLIARLIDRHGVTGRLLVAP